MRIAVCSVQVPFVYGGAEAHQANLVDALKRHGHDVDLVTLPFKWYPPEQISHTILAWMLTDLTESNGWEIDRVIALKFPAWIVPHPQKVAWILHQHRTAYELWGTEFGDLEKWIDGEKIRGQIQRVDKTAFVQCKKLFANSKTVAARLKRYSGFVAEPLYHPSPLAGTLFGKDPEDFILVPGRLDRLKRVDLFLHGLAHSLNPKAVIVGQGPEFSNIRRLVNTLGLGHRVKMLGRVPAGTLKDLYERALAVYYGPFDEDYGYVTLEAMEASKPIITLSDSGGPTEFLIDGETGWVLAASEVQGSMTVAIGERLEYVWNNKNRAKEMGKRGRIALSTANISWDNVVDKLI